MSIEGVKHRPRVVYKEKGTELSVYFILLRIRDFAAYTSYNAVVSLVTGADSTHSGTILNHVRH